MVCYESAPDAVQHLSLSRTVYLRGHQVEPFVADVKKALTWATRCVQVLHWAGTGPQFSFWV
eukprot:35310-Eustigmatos_ZCMA.PRE.1